MSKLNEIVAVAASKKAAAEKALTNAYHLAQKEDLFNGLRKNYMPLDENGKSLPSESKNIQLTINKLIGDVSLPWINMVDVVATQETGNSTACGTIMIDNQEFMKDVPVTVLIMLEKRITDLQTLVSKLPILTTSETWTKDEATNSWQSAENITHRTEKVQKPIVLYHATAEHPAQTQLVTEDVMVGHWHTTKLSGALAPAVRATLLNRITKFKESIIRAREQANSTDVQDVKIGEKLFNAIFS